MSWRTEQARRAARRGTATAEAVVALPVLTLLFVASFYLRDLTSMKQDAVTQARTCAWIYSENNCTGGLPSYCSAPIDAQDAAYSDQALDDETLKLSGGSVAAFALSLIGDAKKALFGGVVATSVAHEVPRPAAFGGATVTTVGTYRIACNVGERTLLQVAEDAWNTIKPF
jgi:hypothetical protein